MQNDAQPLMTGRVALVTGGSRGIGAATAKLLAQYGATIAVNYFGKQAAAQSVVDEIQASGGQAIALQGSVIDEASVNNLIEQTIKSFGAIDTLVLNASGSFVTAPFVDYKWSDFEKTLLGDLKAVFFPCKAVVPQMIEQGRGSIVIVSSSRSRMPTPGFIAHATGKSGVDAFVRNLALELGPQHIRVNAVAPGMTLTDTTAYMSQDQKDVIAQMTPLRRNGLPEDIRVVAL